MTLGAYCRLASKPVPSLQSARRRTLRTKRGTPQLLAMTIEWTPRTGRIGSNARIIVDHCGGKEDTVSWHLQRMPQTRAVFTYPMTSSLDPTRCTQTYFGFEQGLRLSHSPIQINISPCKLCCSIHMRYYDFERKETTYETHAYIYMCECVCVCVRACVRVCVCACVRV